MLDDLGVIEACNVFTAAPLHAQDRLRPLFEALVMSVVREAQSRAQAGPVASPGLLLMLDECGTAAPLRDLPTLAATGRGQGIQLVSVFQDRGQIEQRNGRLADSVLTNHRDKLALSGIADLGTLDYFSKLLGDTDVDRHSVTDSTTGRSTSTSQQRERLAPGRRAAPAPARVGPARLRQPPTRPGPLPTPHTSGRRRATATDGLTQRCSLVSVGRSARGWPTGRCPLALPAADTGAAESVASRSGRLLSNAAGAQARPEVRAAFRRGCCPGWLGPGPAATPRRCRGGRGQCRRVAALRPLGGRDPVRG